MFGVWKRVRRGGHSFGEVTPERGQLSNRISCRDGPYGVGTRPAYGMPLPSFGQMDTRTGRMRYIYLVGRSVLHIFDFASVRHCAGPLLGNHRAYRLYEKEDAETRGGSDRRYVAGGLLDIRSTHAHHEVAAQKQSRRHGQP